MNIKIENFSIGQPKEMHYGENQEVVTGICKETVEEAFLSFDGFRGDGVADLRHHGGLDRAVCVYPYEHYQLWEKEFGVPLPRSTFGENLTVSGMLESDIHIGDVFRVGEAVIQVTCQTKWSSSNRVCFKSIFLPFNFFQRDN